MSNKEIRELLLSYISHGGMHGGPEDAYYIRPKNGGDGFVVICDDCPTPCLEFRYTIDRASAVEDAPTGALLPLCEVTDTPTFWDKFDALLEEAHQRCECDED